MEESGFGCIPRLHLVVGIVGLGVPVEFRRILRPRRIEADILVARHRAWRSMSALGGGRAHFPPALALVTVFVVDDIAGLGHQRPGPAHAVVAIITVILQFVADQKPARGTVMKVDPKHILAVRDVETQVGRLLQECVSPVFQHAGNSPAPDQVARMALAVVVDGLVPVLEHELMAADALAPPKGPLVVPAELVAADRERPPWTGPMPGGAGPASVRAWVWQQLPLPPLSRTVSPAASARAEPGEEKCRQNYRTTSRAAARRCLIAGHLC